MKLYPLISDIYVALALDAYPIPCQGSLCHWRKIGYFTDSVQAPQHIGFCPGSSRWFLLDLSNEDMVI